MKIWQRIIAVMVACSFLACGIASVSRGWLNARELKICYKESAVLREDVTLNNGFAKSTKYEPKTATVVGCWLLVCSTSVIGYYIFLIARYFCHRKAEDRALQRKATGAV